MGWKLNDNGRIMSEINITPLTDVMLVLLVIFMVTTPLIMAESFKIRLPQAVTSGAEKGEGVVIAVSEAGVIEHQGRAMTLDELYPLLKKEFDSGTERTVVVKADTATRHGIVVGVLDTAKLAGAVRLSIATEREVVD